MKSRKVGLGLLLGAALLLVSGVAPAFAQTGSVNFYTPTAGVCPTPEPTPNNAAAQTWPRWAYGGTGPVPGISSNVPSGQPPNANAPVVDQGQSICVYIDLSGLPAVTGGETITVSAPWASNTFTIQVDSNGVAISGENYGVLTDTAIGSATTCQTGPIKLSDGGGPGGQIFHVLLATSTGATGCFTTVPEFPFGVFAAFAVAVPALLLLRSKIPRRL